MKKSKIKKIGNSQGLIIPKEMLALANISEHVIISVEDNKIIVKPDFDITLNQTVQDCFKKLKIELLPENVIRLQGLELPLNSEQINLLNNQIDKHG